MVILAAALFPFACLGWAGVVFAFQAVVNELLLHRDAGPGDTWTCPLPNGYAITMIDVTDYGWVYNPRTQTRGVIGEQEDAVSGVVDVQVPGRYILGSSNSRVFEEDAGGNQADAYFLLDTRSGHRTALSSYEALRESAQQLGIELNLRPIERVYSEFRYTWFDAFAGLLLCAVPLILGLLLVWWILRLRKRRAMNQLPA